MGEGTSQPKVEESTEPPLCDPEEAREKDQTVPGVPNENVHYAWANKHAKVSHTLDPETVAELLDAHLRQGLTEAEAESRLHRHGPNLLTEAKGVPVWEILLRQVSNSLTVVLVMTMGLSFGIKDWTEGGVISAVIVLNIVVGFIQDYRAEKNIASLMALSAPTATVVRDGRVVSIKAEHLVPGDVVKLSVGDIVPADLRLFDGINPTADEANLTGESLPVSKDPIAIFADADLPVADRSNMAYSQSTMTAGRGTGIVVCTGMETEVGKIAGMLQQDDSQVDEEEHSNATRKLKSVVRGVRNVLGLNGTPLSASLSKFALLLFALAILLAIIVFSANRWNLKGENLIYGVCVAVAVVPESLLAVLTITLAVGSKAMAKGNVLTRNIQALEAIGGVTHICSDKTGTLTQGRMIVRQAWIPGTGVLSVHDSTKPFDPTNGHLKLNDEDFDRINHVSSSGMSLLMRTIALCNLSSVEKPRTSKNAVDLESRQEQMSQTQVDGAGPIEKPPQSAQSDEWTAIGEPTEIALHVLALRVNMGRADVLHGDMQHAAEFSFDSAGKKMTVVYRNPSGMEAFTKGAVEIIMPLLACSDQEKLEIQSIADEMAGEGLRVLCVAYKSLPHGFNLSDRKRVEVGLDLVGLVGLYDPPRLETADAVRRCQLAGISVHMLTGDHIRTATAIAHEVGILPSTVPLTDNGKIIMSAEAFDQLSDAEIDAMENMPLVIARCSPTTKVRVVEAIHRKQAFCVMTGDGVNDSPALKRADVGVAMGLNGSDVAKQAAAMVLTDDNFASIVKAVEEGRRLFDNIQKFLLHLLISNIAQVILLLIGLAFRDDGRKKIDSNPGDKKDPRHAVFPLSPLEILWVNLITSSFLALGLGLEEAQPNIMFRPPHSLRIGVFTRELIIDKFIYGTFMGGLCLVAFTYVAYAIGRGDLGFGCNDGWNYTCEVVFRARSTTYATLTFLLLATAWEVKHFSRSLFNLDPRSEYDGLFSVFPTVWRNRFLFWAVVAGFVLVFPVIYLPFINKKVFKHSAIDWEWGVVFGCLFIYIVLIEMWKGIKRRFGIGSGKYRLLTREDAEKRAGLGHVKHEGLEENAADEV
ncbi:putative potassium/sodium P-type ATPase [Lophium mytilinum]|uniref:P-type Na(+) transporter n=1 Tax=Lophium mytilinum TaxID=390894 RepID=A0A6A6QWC3_9PEZI|nr:putative potassium/sodium P-type ATPase [Lophium mytilinum]